MNLKHTLVMSAVVLVLGVAGVYLLDISTARKTGALVDIKVSYVDASEKTSAGGHFRYVSRAHFQYKKKEYGYNRPVWNAIGISKEEWDTLTYGSTYRCAEYQSRIFGTFSFGECKKA